MQLKAWFKCVRQSVAVLEKNIDVVWLDGTVDAEYNFWLLRSIALAIEYLHLPFFT